MSRELLLELELTPVARCKGSGELPWRTVKGRAECAVCGRRYAPKLDGRVRRHPTADVYLPVKHIDKPE